MLSEAFLQTRMPQLKLPGADCASIQFDAPPFVGDTFVDQQATNTVHATSDEVVTAVDLDDPRLHPILSGELTRAAPEIIYPEQSPCRINAKSLFSILLRYSSDEEQAKKIFRAILNSKLDESHYILFCEPNLFYHCEAFMRFVEQNEIVVGTSPWELRRQFIEHLGRTECYRAITFAESIEGYFATPKDIEPPCITPEFTRNKIGQGTLRDFLYHDRHAIFRRDLAEVQESLSAGKPLRATVSLTRNAEYALFAAVTMAKNKLPPEKLAQTNVALVTCSIPTFFLMDTGECEGDKISSRLFQEFVAFRIRQEWIRQVRAVPIAQAHISFWICDRDYFCHLNDPAFVVDYTGVSPVSYYTEVRRSEYVELPDPAAIKAAQQRQSWAERKVARHSPELQKIKDRLEPFITAGIDDAQLKQLHRTILADTEYYMQHFESGAYKYAHDPEAVIAEMNKKYDEAGGDPRKLSAMGNRPCGFVSDLLSDILHFLNHEIEILESFAAEDAEAALNLAWAQEQRKQVHRLQLNPYTVVDMIREDPTALRAFITIPYADLH